MILEGLYLDSRRVLEQPSRPKYGVETGKTSTVGQRGPLSHTVEVRDEADREPENQKRFSNRYKTSVEIDPDFSYPIIMIARFLHVITTSKY